MHMKRHLYERLRSHRRKCLNIDMHKHHSGECHTHSATHTYTQSIQLGRFLAPHDTKHNALVSTGNSTLRKQHVKTTILDLRGGHHISRVLFSDVLCRSHFGLR